MSDAQTREAAFRQELADLLAKHGAEMQITDDGRPWGLHCGICRITMPSIYKDGVLVADSAEFEL